MDKYHVLYDNTKPSKSAWSVVVEQRINYGADNCCYFYAQNLSHETAKEIAEAMNEKERK